MKKLKNIFEIALLCAEAYNAEKRFHKSLKFLYHLADTPTLFSIQAEDARRVYMDSMDSVDRRYNNLKKQS